MKILILGAAGFIGTNLALELAKKNENKITLVDTNTNFFRNELRAYHNVQLVEASLFDKTSFDDILEGQDVLFHLVSSTVPTTSNTQISEELRNNVIFSANLLESCVRCGVKKVVFISSGGTVYGRESDCPIKEESPTYPISSYGIQKITIEKLLYLYHYLYGLDYRVVRLSNPYGPYQRPNGILGVVNTFAYKALLGENINVYGDGSVIRDFIYIDDAIHAMLKITNGNSKYKVFNVGSGIGTSVNEIIAIIRDVLNIDIEVQYTEGRKVDLPMNYLDISRYESCYGRLCSTDLVSGIKKTISFLKQEYDL